jgi:hypothetical protein
MTKDQVQVGEKYEAKVGARWVEVRIEGGTRGGWNARSLGSGKPVRIKDARLLRPGPTAAPQRAPDAPGATISPEATRTPAEVTPRAKRPARAKAAAMTATATEAPAEKLNNAPAKPAGKLSCLNAAAQVLQQANEPLQCKTMVARMQEQGLWTTTAPTPAATLYSAILREMTTKGANSRFKKTDRGHFGLNG